MNKRFWKQASCIFFFIISFGILAQNVDVDDLVSYSERGLFNFLKKNRYDTKKFAVVFICKEIGSYYAFSKNIPDSLILRFQQALDKLKFKHTQLVNKYLRD